MKQKFFVVTEIILLLKGYEQFKFKGWVNEPLLGIVGMSVSRKRGNEVDWIVLFSWFILLVFLIGHRPISDVSWIYSFNALNSSHFCKAKNLRMKQKFFVVTEIILLLKGYEQFKFKGWVNEPLLGIVGMSVSRKRGNEVDWIVLFSWFILLVFLMFKGNFIKLHRYWVDSRKSESVLMGLNVKSRGHGTF